MTADQAARVADLKAQSRLFWSNRGDDGRHNVKPGSVKAKRAADWRGRRRKWSRWLAEVAEAPPR